LEEALARLHEARAPELSAAGRTDAGVHARGQVVSFASAADPGRLQRAVNGMLAPEVVVRDARRARAGFDARFSATGREYRYRIDTAAWPDPLAARFVWHRPGELALEPMRRAAADLVGRHDFASFCRRPQGERTTIRTLRRLAISSRGRLLTVTAEADGFLHQMVRSLVGTLVDAGQGRLGPASIPQVLAARDRRAAGRVAPPQGLTLERVRYGRAL
jgi:tRNA pseudouridine38-40 synthase